MILDLLYLESYDQIQDFLKDFPLEKEACTFLEIPLNSTPDRIEEAMWNKSSLFELIQETLKEMPNRIFVITAYDTYNDEITVQIREIVKRKEAIQLIRNTENRTWKV